MYKGNILVLGFNLESSDSEGVPMNYRKSIQNQFPAEVDLCGLIKFGTCTDAEAHLNEILADVDVTDNPILLTCDIGGCENLKAFFLQNGKLVETAFEVMLYESNATSLFLHSRNNSIIPGNVRGQVTPELQLCSAEVRSARVYLRPG